MNALSYNIVPTLHMHSTVREQWELHVGYRSIPNCAYLYGQNPYIDTGTIRQLPTT